MRARCAYAISPKVDPPGPKQLPPAELPGPSEQVMAFVRPPLEPEPAFERENWVWLKTLKASARNSIAALSLIAKCLKIPMSKVSREGLRMSFRPAFPKVSPVGRAKAPGLMSNFA